MSTGDLLPGLIQRVKIHGPFEPQGKLHVVSAARRQLFQQPEPRLCERGRAGAMDGSGRNRLFLLETDSSFLKQS